MEFRVIDHCPVPVELAELVGCLKRDVPGAVLQSCYRGEDARALLHANGKHTQAECVALHAQGVPGFGPANPSDRGSHLMLGDGTFGKLHAKLPAQQCGMDWDDAHVAALIKAAAARGWDLRRPYSAGSEYHHLCAYRWPELGVVLGMARGSERPSVRHLIRRLGFIGHACGPERDTFDERVDRAVRAYQRKHKLTADGKVGPRTWAEISKSVAWHKANPGPVHGPAAKPAPKPPAPKPAGRSKPKPAARPTRASARGVQLIADFEGFRPRPYNDPVGLATVGFGHLIAHRPVTGADRAKWGTLTRAAGLRLLASDLRTYEHAVASALRVRVSQAAFDALVSFTYNLGPNALRTSTLLRRLNAGAPRAQVAAEFLKWDKAGSPPRALPGLTRRRRTEAALFVK